MWREGSKWLGNWLMAAVRKGEGRTTSGEWWRLTEREK